MTLDLHDTIRLAQMCDINILPPKEDGSKAPDADEWTRYQERRSTPEEIQHWYANGRTGFGAVCGAVSANLTLFDFDDLETYHEYKVVGEQAGLSDVIERIEAGYLEETPRGTFHWLYRCEQVLGSTKLARRLKRPEEKKHPNDNVYTKIETKGKGGYAVLAPSSGRVHETGRPYKLLRGNLSTITIITPEEQEAVFTLARAFDEMPREEAKEYQEPAPQSGDELRPGDDFKARASWDDTGLFREGWQRVYERRGTVYLRRPGKSIGVSATLNYKDSDLFYPFTTSSVFDSERGYNKFSVYAILNHNGDFKAAAKELARRGYGTRAEQATTPTPDPARSAGGLIRLSDVQPERVSPLWPGRIYLGKLTILDGDPGTGKTTLDLDIGARVSTGREMPDGSWGDLDGPAGVLILSAEDGLADTIRPRLDAAGADVTRIVARQTIIETSGSIRMPTLGDLSQLEMDIAVVGARLVIIDPVMAYLPSDVKSHVDAEVRRVLAPLADLAERTGAAFLVNRHLNKVSGGNPLYRGGGSIAFTGAARSVLLAARDPDDDTDSRFVLASLKSNLGKKAPALAYHIEEADNGASYIKWDGPSKYSADELLSDTNPEERGALADAVAFLRDYLQDGPCKATEVQKAAGAAGVSDRTLRRAKDRLKVRAERVGAITDAHWEWRLPSD